MNQPPRIVSNPVRDPVNRQAALIIRRASFIDRPPETASTQQQELERLQKELNAVKSTSIAQAQQLTNLRHKNDKLEAELIAAKQDLADKVKFWREKEKELSGERLRQQQRLNNRAETMVRLNRP